MKICDSNSHTNPEFIIGHLYQRADGVFIDQINILVKHFDNTLTMFSLTDNSAWSTYIDKKWVDVTDQYCLTRV